MRFDYSTRTQLLSRIREHYRTATGDRAVKCATFLSQASDAELREAFAMTQGQVASLKGRMQANAARGQAVKDAVGE